MTLADARRLVGHRCVSKAIRRKNLLSVGGSRGGPVPTWFAHACALQEADERLAGARTASPRVARDGPRDVLLVAFDGLVPAWLPAVVAKKRAGLAVAMTTARLAEREPEFFWNLVHAAGGAAALRAHNGDVLTAYDAATAI